MNSTNQFNPQNDSTFIDIDITPPQQEEPMCRICFESTNQEDMLHPCLCKGTSKYIHRNCLNQWRSLSTNPTASTHCTECKFEYRTQEFLPIEKQNCKKLGTFMAENTFIFFILNNLIIILFSYLIQAMDTKKKIRNLIAHNDTIGYYSWSLIFYTFSIIISFLVAFLTVKNKCLYINYYREKITLSKFMIAFIVIFISIFIDPLLTSLITTIFIQIFIKWHFDSIARINAANDQTILNYNYQEDDHLQLV